MKKKLMSALKEANNASGLLAALNFRKRQKVLYTLETRLRRETKAILAANKKDIAFAKKAPRNKAFIDRLTLTEKRFNEMLEQVKNISQSQDVLGKIIEKKRLANGVVLQKMSVPLGVIAIIYESRPNVTI